MILNQQFIREPSVVPVLGIDNEEQLKIVMPELLQGDFEFESQPIADAVMKQENQASATALIQLAAQLVPIAAALAQSGTAKALNLDAFVEDLLRAFGKDDVQRYFVSQPPAMLPGAGPAGGQNPDGSQPAPGAPPAPGVGQGVTASQSVDPATSPSADISMAPATLMQRALAMSGGGRSV
jgi:hypothetical protein